MREDPGRVHRCAFSIVSAYRCGSSDSARLWSERGIQFAKHLLEKALETETGMKRVLFVGPTGAGKSLGAGAVLGNYHAFEASAGTASKTKGTQTAKSLVHKVELTDSEGVGDTSITDMWSFLRGSRPLIDSLLKLMKEAPKGSDPKSLLDASQRHAHERPLLLVLVSEASTWSLTLHGWGGSACWMRRSPASSRNFN